MFLRTIIALTVFLCISLNSAAVSAKGTEDPALTLMYQGKWNEALRTFETYKGTDAKSEAGIQLNKAICHGHLGRYDKKLEGCNKALRLDPSLITVFVARSDCYIHLGEPEKALEDCNKGLVLDPLRASLYCNRGEAHFLLGNHQKAIQDLSRAIELSPSFGEAYYYRGLAYSKVGNDKEAAADSNTCKKLGYKPGTSSLLSGEQKNKVNRQ